MAQQMSYTDATQTEWPESYWTIVSTAGSVRDGGRFVITIRGFKDQAAFDAGAQPVAQRGYELSGDEFWQHFASPVRGDEVGLPFGVLQGRRVWAYVLTVADVRDDKGGAASFFADSKEVD